ncbi:MAG: cobyrinate a,c-diamide synthase [Pseudomonadota bacterium]
MNTNSKSGLMIAAPSSGSGKTVITLALLRALKDEGLDICAAKAGPDYIDPGFHAISCGSASVNLDPWAMSGKRLIALAHRQTGSHLLVEAMMGLFDGAADGTASPASLAKELNIPVILVVDAAKQSHSIAALVRGFRDHDPKLSVEGVILNKVGSARHEKMLRDALRSIGITVLGAVPRSRSLEIPERHLGLVQAQESSGIESFIEGAAELLSSHCDLTKLKSMFRPLHEAEHLETRIKPLGQRVAIARDVAFSFIYPHLLQDWRKQGAELSFFSPLKDEAPDQDADAVYLPGGYPELYGEKLSEAAKFKEGMISARDRGALIYGECGGYMVLGDAIINKEGQCHSMTGLLKLETSFEKRKLHLGYRNLRTTQFVFGKELKAHEFHYTTAINETGESLFEVSDALGGSLGSAGLRDGKVMGSYMHVIDAV